MLKKQPSRKQKLTADAQMHSKALKNPLPRSGNFFDRVVDIYENPAFKYMAGDLAGIAFTKFFEKFTQKYPELTNLISGGLSTVEDKLVDYKKIATKSEDPSLQH